MKSRRQFGKDYKAKIAIEALKGQRTANEIAQEFGIHVSQVNEWKKQLLDGASEVFSRGQERIAVEQEAERDRLYQQIGKLQVEVEWLKKKTSLPVGR
jgi:transposase-like protein